MEGHGPPLTSRILGLESVFRPVGIIQGLILTTKVRLLHEKVQKDETCGVVNSAPVLGS